MSWLLLALALVALAALLCGLRMIEITYIRLGRARAAGLDEADETDDRLVRITLDREAALSPVTLLRLASQLIIVATVGVLAANRWSAGGVVGALALVGLGLFVVGEAVPRRWALESNDRMARLLHGPARGLARVAPLRWLAGPALRLARWVGPKHQERQSSEVAGDELVALAEAAAQASLIEEGEADLIESVIDLSDTIVREVMVPRPDMTTLDASITIAAALRVIVDSGYTRLPVLGDSADDVLGIVLAKDLMGAELDGAADHDARTLMRPAHFVPETKRVFELMREMQAEKFHLAVVIDEYGGTAGLVSLEDIIEEMVGEIVDEFDDEVSLVEHVGDGRLILAGRLPVDDLEELLDIDVPDGDWDTVGGLVFDLLGHVPDPGESVDYLGWSFSAAEIDGRRISLVAVERATEMAP